MKKLRKSQLSLFMACILLFASCSSPSIDKESIEREFLTKVVSKHIEISEEIALKFTNEEELDLNFLFNSPKYFKTSDELKNNLVKAKFKNVEELTFLFKELNENITSFLESINARENYTEEEVQKIISDEINKQFDENNNAFLNHKQSSCYSNFERAKSRCNRNWYLANAAVAISGFFTLGIGTLVGATAAGSMAILCITDARSDLNECLN